MMIQNCFFITLATLLNPDDYCQEFKVAKKILGYLKEIYPELKEDTWKEYILESYELHQGHLSIGGRLDYIKGIILCENYSNRNIDDIMMEQKRIILKYRSISGKPSKHIKLAIFEFIYQQFMARIQEDTKLLLFTFPASSIPQ